MTGIIRRALLCAPSLALLPRAGLAQAWPARPIRLIVPFPTGASQILGLLVSERLGAALANSPSRQHSQNGRFGSRRQQSRERDLRHHPWQCFWRGRPPRCAGQRRRLVLLPGRMVVGRVGRRRPVVVVERGVVVDFARLLDRFH